MIRPGPAPACTCSSGSEAGTHRSTCAFARWAVANQGRAREGLSDGLGRRNRHQTAKRTEARGIRFASGLEARTFERLMQRRDALPGSLLLRQPHFDLWASWRAGMGKPLIFTPDFLLGLPRDVRALEPEEQLDDVGARTGGTWVERVLSLWDVEVHEAKAPRKLESRDYVPRLAAFRAAHASIPVFVWRSAGAAVEPERLADLSPQGGA